MMWYIWLSEGSPLFGKDKMATFERYFLAEKETHKEKKNPYYSLLEEEDVVNGILKEFGLPEEDTHIINGHVPVKSKNGENPVKCGGKVMVIDGGFSKAYQKETGIVDRVLERKLVGDTDDGRDLKEQIADLEVLLRAYRSGQIAERL